MSATLKRLLDRTRANPAIHELAIAAKNTRTGKAATGFLGRYPGGDIGPDAPYFLASATKLFITAIVMQLVEKKALGLETPMFEFFAPGYLEGLHVLGGRDRTEKITVGHLLSHTSGLADYFEQKQAGGKTFAGGILGGQDRAFGLDDVVGMVRSGMKPAFVPGKRGRAFYSDTNFQLLGAIIERVSGLGLGEVIEGQICVPLGLKNTYLYDHAGARASSKVVAMRYGDRQLDIPKAMTGVAADGGVVSTAADGLVFIEAFFDGALFPKPMLGPMMAIWRRIFFPLRYGTGIMFYRLPAIFSLIQKQPTLIGHSGISGAFLFAEPDTGVYLSGTVNQLGSRSLPYRVMLEAASAMGS
ncbi:MAG: beta-lactamase family protein [Alphaproteobacteria bacterium]|nr:beta-lactamase family protein [Alphaproteobacteria bacterium]